MPETQQSASSAPFPRRGREFPGLDALDAFDFFVVVFPLRRSGRAVPCVEGGHRGHRFLYTLLMRPVGALVFGLLADRYGRRTAADRQREIFR